MSPRDTGPVRTAICALIAALLVAACGGDKDERRAAAAPTATPTATAPPAPTATPAPPALPDPHEPLPRSPKRLAAGLATDVTRLKQAIGAWRATHPPRKATPPRPITLLALYEQRVYRRLARHPAQATRTIDRLPNHLKREARASAGAYRALFTLTSYATEAKFRTGPAVPPDVLLGYYRAAQRRFSVHWNVLAAVNMIESNFGRLRNVSNAGAVGPMQFLPATWNAYGLGGDIHDPHDAIFGAANYLHASGAPNDHARALYAYNPSPLYVKAVLRFADRIRRDRRAYYASWAWQSFRRTPRGDVQLTGPGRGRR